MMKFLREKMKIVFLIVVLAFLATIVLVWGMGSGRFGSGTPDTIVTVNGTPISIQQYTTAYNNQLEQYKEMFKNQDIPEQLLDMVKKNAVDSLIMKTVVMQEAIKQNMAITEEDNMEVKRRIKGYFVKDGKFYSDGYEYWLKSNPERFLEVEHDLKVQITVEKLQRMIKGSAKVSEQEVRDEFLKNNEKRKIRYVKIDAKAFLKNVTISDDDIKKYYDGNSQFYKIPEKFRTKIASVDLSKEYDKKAKLKAEVLIKQLKAGADFSKLAAENSQDPGSKDKGGDLGFFKKGAMVPEFEKAAFALKTGEMTDVPVKSSLGYHIIKCVEIKGEEIKASHILIRSLPDEAIKTVYTAKASELQKKIASGADFDSSAAASGFESRTIEFGAADYVNAVDDQEKLKAAVKGLAVNAVSEVIETNADFFIVKLLGKTGESMKTLASVKQEIKAKLETERALPLAELEGKKILNDIKGGKTSFEAACKPYGIKETDYFKSSETDKLKGMDNAQEIAASAFAIPAVNAVGKAVKTVNGAYLFKLVDKKVPSDQEYMKQKDDLKTSLLTKKQDALFSQWLQSLKQKAKISPKDYMESLKENK